MLAVITSLKNQTSLPILKKSHFYKGQIRKNKVAQSQIPVASPWSPVVPGSKWLSLKQFFDVKIIVK